MRLLVVTQYFWPENFRINDLVADFVARGHEVTVLTGEPNYPAGSLFPDYVESPGKYIYFEGADIVRVPIVPRGKGGLQLMINYAAFALSATVIGAWRLKGRPFDVIFVYEPSPITVGLPAIVLKWLKGANIAFWVLDLWPDTLSAIGVVKSPFILKAIGALVSFIYRRCDIVLAQSNAFISQIRIYAEQKARIEYFPSWAESIFDGSIPEPASEVMPKPGAFNIMFAGNIGEAQDFPAIIDAATRLKNDPTIRWLILGDGRQSTWLAGELARRGLEDTVVLLGRCPLERVPSFFAHADALLVSLKDEPIFAMTIPGKVQAYLSSGKPILAMLNGEGAEILSQAGAGLTCAAGDGEGLAAIARQLAMTAPEEREAMGARGQALYAREFERGMLLDRLEAWLSVLANRRGHEGLRL